ncbi:Succinate dehydrogenase/fumarate reductase, flavoprotein subunit [Desulfitobacterium sp. LBE]|uniref:FAD-dependent oxidoreductase n=1 Tax=Desulfitobacterium sp. LBE TaxID=884086 RepID=UPI0011999A13|nr:FAD-dependent oxidoreductase [Desulfitobacterium sp. LBE]TWH60152.1 Succinate dehydrogenase/fumarate reductase, flavoprotein subunit [Desulfitobacterium sp. LBE]
MERKGLSRRDFLKGTVAGTVGISTVGLLSACATQETSGKGEQKIQEPAEEAGKVSWKTPPQAITEFVSTINTEVLVVGAGNAGLFAACAAAEKGAKVTVIERNAMVGVGREWIGAIGSRLQKEAGVNINKFEVIEELSRYASHRVDQKIIKLWADNSGQTVDWLENVVKEYGAYMVLETDTGEPIHGVYKTFAIQHSIQNDEKHLDSTQILKEKAKELGVEVLFETTMVQVVRENNNTGRVSGIIAKTKDGHIKIDASKGTILCTGGYGGNKEMVEELNPLAVQSCTGKEAPPGCQGDGIKAATWVGAAKDDIATAQIFDRAAIKPGADGKDWSQAAFLHMGSQPFLKVNLKGERFANESVPYDFIVHAASLQPGDRYCMIWDGNWKEHTRQFHTIGCSRLQYSKSGSKLIVFDENATEGMHNEALIPQGFIVESDTLEGLAEKLQLPVNTFVKTVQRYNELCQKGVDEDFGKESYRMLALEKAPFRGAVLGGQLICTCDGLRINTNLQVLDVNLEPIEGLYAAGNDSGGFFADNYPELIIGSTCGRAITFGRLAGQIVASL